jgi:hypothetical protein
MKMKVGRDFCIYRFDLPERNLPVRYEHKELIDADRQNTLLHIFGNLGNKRNTPLYLNQGVNMYVSGLTYPEAVVEYKIEER